jgi:uncharacterized protein (TIGR02145 family)
MPSLLSRIIVKSLLFGFLTFTLNSCEDTKPVLNPDYTGQTGQVADIEGNIYNTIGMGSQIWMAENLKTTTLKDNSLIPSVLNDSIWATNYYHSPGYCWYNNDSTINKKVYGALYNYYIVETELLCPSGWHVPTTSEWNTLESYLGGSEIAGGKLKDYYKSYWKDPNPCIVNNYGFYAFPGGERLNFSGRFVQINESGFWWTQNQKDDFYAYSRAMSFEDKSLRTFEINKKVGCSVRCIKD